MSKFFMISLLIILSIGCAPSRFTTKLPDFKVDNKNYNRLIENRIPKYGDGNRDGCVIMSEASININALDSEQISGVVTDSESGAPLMGAQITLIVNHLEDSIKIYCDSRGRFTYNALGQINKLTLSYPGFRGLIINLSKIN